MPGSDIVISNTTPLISLADIGELEILHQLYGEILIPEAVLKEIKSEPAKTLVHNSSWIKTCTVTNTEEKKLYSSRLHAGEVEVMILAREKSAALVLMDDNAAKKTAKFMGLNVSGTLGVLVYAKERGLIQEVKPFITALIQDGMYVSDKVKNVVLKWAKED